MPTNPMLIRPADISALSQSTYQCIHRRTSSVHLSMTGSASNKGIPSTATPSSVNVSAFSSDIENLDPARPLPYEIMPEPSVPGLIARPQSANPLLEQDARLNKIREITMDIHNRKGKDDNVLGALTATFDPHQNDEYFPTKIVEVPPVPGACIPAINSKENMQNI
jgi:hypothetical protein